MLRENEIKFYSLVYVTSQDIGTRADDFKSELSRDGVSLEVRDRRYFIDRLHHDCQGGGWGRTSKACRRPPLLPRTSRQLSTSHRPGDEGGPVRSELQLRDTDEGRGITKLTFDSLTLAALRSTTADDQLPRSEVVAYVQKSLPGQDARRVADSVDGALGRLKGKRRIVYTAAADTFALQFDERQRQANRVLELLAEREEVNRELIGSSMQPAASSRSSSSGTPPTLWSASSIRPCRGSLASRATSLQRRFGVVMGALARAVWTPRLKTL